MQSLELSKHKISHIMINFHKSQQDHTRVTRLWATWGSSTGSWQGQKFENVWGVHTNSELELSLSSENNQKYL